VLLPQSDIAARTLEEALRDKGFWVQTVTAYRTVPKPLASSVAADLAAGAFEAVLLTSPSTAQSLARTVISSGTVLGAIGSSTATAASAAGLPIAYTASAPTDAALVGGLVQFAAQNPPRRL
jgi:uroporphyrinogen-III synthase